MNPELSTFQKKLEGCQQEFFQLLHEYARLRRISPRMRTEAAKMLEQYLIHMHRMIKQVNQE